MPSGFGVSIDGKDIEYCNTSPFLVGSVWQCGDVNKNIAVLGINDSIYQFLPRSMVSLVGFVTANANSRLNQ